MQTDCRKIVCGLLRSLLKLWRDYFPENDIYEVGVFYDGSWQKRGHTSNLAIGTVIEAQIGQVLDYKAVSAEVCTKNGNAVKWGYVSEGEFPK